MTQASVADFMARITVTQRLSLRFSRTKMKQNMFLLTFLTVGFFVNIRRSVNQIHINMPHGSSLA